MLARVIVLLLVVVVVCVSAFQVARPMVVSTRTGSVALFAADITSAMVKNLRDKTGAGMMDCKKALVETNGDVEIAVDYLRKKGLAAVQKKADRIASTGLVAVASSADGLAAAAIEMNSETDFVAKNSVFQAAVQQISYIAAAGADTNEKILASAYEGESATVNEEITRLVATIGENMNFRRVERLTVKSGLVATYLHSPLKPNMGKIGCIVALESTSENKAALQELGKNIAMHVAANSPQYLNIAAVDPAAVDRERSVLVDQATASGKPAAAIEKMVEGRIKKFYEEICLLEQPFVMDGKMRVQQVIDATAKEIGAPIELVGFTRMMLGEGLEKRDWTQ